MDPDNPDTSDDGGFLAVAATAATEAGNLNNSAAAPTDNSGNVSPTKSSSSPTKTSRRNRGKESDEESQKSHRSKKGRKNRNKDPETTDYDSDRSRRSHRKSRNDGDNKSVNFSSAALTTDSEREEVIEVQILPQDDNWGDNTTAITSGTSERSWSDLDISRLGRPIDRRRHGLDCHRYFGYIVAIGLGAAAFFSPVAFVIIPNTMWTPNPCGRPATASSLAWLSSSLSWPSAPGLSLFASPGELDYEGTVQYAVSLVDALLFVHYLALILLELRQLQPAYMIKVVRSPDGASKYYTIGQLSIQRAAIWILEQYYRDFHIYNPHLLHVPTSRTPNKANKYKFYSVDGGGNNESVTGRARAVMASEGRRKETGVGRNDRFYEEQEYDRRVKKRKARLEIATEDAFTHIKRLHEDRGASHVMDPTEAAQAIFPSIARSLQKYLRVTRQQPRWNMDTVIRHLATCISYNMSPKAFLEAFFTPGPPVVDSIRDTTSNQTWELVSDTLVSRSLCEGTTFQLRHREIQLQVYIMRIPHFKLNEEAYDYKNNRFTLRLQSETSV
ncbi:putative vang-like protein 2-like isoform X2 [Apostichopus japonicus]|uniref:Vang-like protein n=1 Tax=Stichopus japonicus TaxID=307972 RepID=A0A2G8JU85_STIJA|nr:putative vang-like protein 2-like isoform X2 [Apostichopus japonicus]